MSRMVLADGCFDPLHVGHVRYLFEAATLGPLYVNIAPDSAIEAKGRRPFQTRDERIELLRAMRVVTAVVVDDLATVIRTHKPWWLVKGKDWEGRLPQHVLDACKQTGTKIHYTDTVTRPSSERLAG